MGWADRVAGLSASWRGQSIDAGLPVVEIDNPFCHAVVAYHGAQVLEYIPRGHAPLLWLSEQTHYSSHKAIRGGIPLCFPWFGAHPSDPKLPSHGFARTRAWQLAKAEADDDGHLLVFRLEDDESTRLLWPHGFVAELEMRFGAALTLTLQVTNRDSVPFDFTFAFHSYFSVADVTQTQVTGLENTSYLDQLAPQLGDQLSEATPIRFSAETDRIYQGGAGRYRIAQTDGKAFTQISSADATSVIVWNPWIDKAARLGDMNPNAWPQMLCVECGRVGTAPVSIAAGASATFTLTLESL